MRNKPDQVDATRGTRLRPNPRWQRQAVPGWILSRAPTYRHFAQLNVTLSVALIRHAPARDDARGGPEQLPSHLPAHRVVPLAGGGEWRSKRRFGSFAWDGQYVAPNLCAMSSSARDCGAGRLASSLQEARSSHRQTQTRCHASAGMQNPRPNNAGAEPAAAPEANLGQPGAPRAGKAPRQPSRTP